MIFNSNPSANKLRYYMNFFMVALYIALGLLFLFTDIAIDTFPANRRPIGIICVVYGSFRTAMTIYKIRKANRDER